MRIISLLIATLALGAVTGCLSLYSSPVIPSTAFVYTNTRAPMDIDFENVSVGPKQGKASVTTILLLFAYGDASAAAAAQDGGIQTINHADYEYYSVLGVYQRFTTVVYGD